MFPVYRKCNFNIKLKIEALCLDYFIFLFLLNVNFSSNFVPSFLVMFFSLCFLFSLLFCFCCYRHNILISYSKRGQNNLFAIQYFDCYDITDRQYMFYFHYNIHCANYFTTSLYLITVKSTGSISNDRTFPFFLFLFYLFFVSFSITTNPPNPPPPNKI